MSVLWSVLAGIGTVLLFLLKGVGILLLAVLVLSLLLMFCPFCADVQLSLIHISEPTRPYRKSRMPSSA